MKRRLPDRRLDLSLHPRHPSEPCGAPRTGEGFRPTDGVGGQAVADVVPVPIFMRPAGRYSGRKATKML